MTTPVWKDYYRQIVDGTQVRASVTNAPLNDLFQNQIYLKYRLDTLEAGKALIVPDQTINSGAVVGTPVYLTAAGVWTPAIAELDSTPTSSLFTLTSKAFVAGIVMSKNSYGKGDIAIQGQVTMPSTFINVIEGTYTEGIQYLSPYTAGKLNSSRGIAPVKVCLVYGPDGNGDYRVIVDPEQKLQLESHGHYHFTLLDAPAGDPNCVPGKHGFMWGDLENDGPYPGIVHEVSNPNAALRGWLPATATYFPDKTIPAGAAFGYNVAMDTDLRAVWPPLPVENVSVEVDGINESGDRVVVNADGIWWMTDVYGKAPWPVNLPCSPEASSSSAAYPIWPVRIELWFTKTLHGSTVEAVNNQINLVTALAPAMALAYLGASIPSVMLTPTVAAYELSYDAPGAGSSSSTPSDILDRSIMYRLDSKAYAVIGTRAAKLNVELMLATSAGNTTSVSQILANLKLRVTKIPAPLTSGFKALTDITVTEYAWATYPSGSTVPDAQYFTVSSADITLAARESYTIELVWHGDLLAVTDKVYIVSARPLVTI